MNRKNKLTDIEMMTALGKVHKLFGSTPHEAYFILSNAPIDTLVVEWEGWKSAPYINGRLDEMFKHLHIHIEVHRTMDEQQMREVWYIKQYSVVSNLLHCALNNTYETGQYIKYVAPEC